MELRDRRTYWQTEPTISIAPYGLAPRGQTPTANMAVKGRFGQRVFGDDTTGLC